MFKKIFILSTLFFSFAFSQQKQQELNLVHADSTVTSTLEEIVVESGHRDDVEQKAISDKIKGFYYNDSNRAVTYKPGVMSILPILAETTIDNMPGDFTGTYYGEDMSIPVLGSKTTFQGGASTINSDLFEISLEQDGYSSVTSHIGGIKRFYSKKKPEGIEVLVSGDITERRIAGRIAEKKIFGAETNLGISYREIYVLPQISKMVKVLEMLPRVSELSVTGETKVGDFKTEFYFLDLNQTQEYRGENSWGVDNIDQQIKHNFAVVKMTKQLNKNKVKFATSYEYEDVYLSENKNELQRDTKNFTVNAEFTNNRESRKIGVAAYLFRQSSLKEVVRDIYSMYVETKEVAGSFLFEVTSAFSYYKGRIGDSETIKATTFLKNAELQAGLSRYSTFLIENQTVLGKGNFDKKEEKSAESNQAFVKINFKNILDATVELSLFYKHFSTEYQKEGYVQGHSTGVRLLLENQNLNSAISGFVSDSKINNHKIGGSIDSEIQYVFWLNVMKESRITGMLTYRTGLWTKNKQNDFYEKLNGSLNFNVGLNTKMNFLDADVEFFITGFNLLKLLGLEQELLRVQKQDGTYIAENSPLWGNVQINIKKFFK